MAPRFAPIRKSTKSYRGLQRIVQTTVHFEMRKGGERRARDGSKSRL